MGEIFSQLCATNAGSLAWFPLSQKESGLSIVLIATQGESIFPLLILKSNEWREREKIGTCGNDFCTKDDVAFILLGASADGITDPTADQICNAIISAEKLINGYLLKSTAYTTVPTPVTGITIQLVMYLLSIREAWENALGASSISDPLGSSSYPPDLVKNIIPQTLKEQLDAFKKQEDFYLSEEPPFEVQNIQEADLDFSYDCYQ